MSDPEEDECDMPDDKESGMLAEAEANGGADGCKDHSPVARANRHYATTIRPCRPASTTSPQSSTSHCISTFSRIVLVPLRCVLWLALYVYKTRTLVLPMKLSPLSAVLEATRLTLA